MVVYDVDAPAAWDFSKYNERSDLIRDFLAQRRARALRVPYRQNRAIVSIRISFTRPRQSTSTPTTPHTASTSRCSTAIAAAIAITRRGTCRTRSFPRGARRHSDGGADMSHSYQGQICLCSNYSAACAAGSSSTRARRTASAAAKRWPAGPPAPVTKRARTVRSVLRDAGAPRVIDYWSLDTEGSELAILRSFPFDEYRFRVLTVEHNCGPARDDLRQFLESRGYSRVRLLGIDDAYVWHGDLPRRAWRSRAWTARAARGA